MVNSYHGNSSNNSMTSDNGIVNHALQMSTSLIENIKNDSDNFSLASMSGMSSSVTTKTYNSTESTPRNITPNPYNGLYCNFTKKDSLAEDIIILSNNVLILMKMTN